MRFSFWAFALLLLLLSSTVSGQKHLTIAKSYIGIKEATGHNDGEPVETFLRSVGRKRGDSWCAAFVSYCLTKANIKDPKTRSGLARLFKREKYIKAADVLRGIKIIESGSIVGWEKGSTISGHIGFVSSNWKGQSGNTIEGNTSSGEKGSQADGDGVYARKRSIMPANYFRICWFVPVRY